MEIGQDDPGVAPLGTHASRGPIGRLAGGWAGLGRSKELSGLLGEQHPQAVEIPACNEEKDDHCSDGAASKPDAQQNLGEKHRGGRVSSPGLLVGQSPTSDKIERRKDK